MIEYIVVNLKARLQPMHRHELEDAFLEYCENGQLNLDICGGGTLMDNQTNEPLECDIEISGADEEYQMSNDDVEKVAQFFINVFAPKGSSLKIYEQDEEEPKVITIGNLEGLSLTVKGSGLPIEVYKNCDINDVADKCNELMEEDEIGGMMHSYHEDDDTHLYFYGKSFEKMKNAIMPFINEYPLCQECEIKQIA